ncbi:MAG: cobyrinate a,c-diamide synthase [Alphaproteobacteria bacterium]
MQAPGLVIAATQSSSGKTLVTLGLVRAFTKRGLAVGSFKVGPDYIDPAFHRAAGAVRCPNLDSWAMQLPTLARLAEAAAHDVDLVIGEGVMGLFDGGPEGRGSTADLASLLGLPVVLIVDAKGMGQSVAALAAGFAEFRDDVDVVGVICNRTGGARHDQLLAEALDARLPRRRLGVLPFDSGLELPSRHLGLVQARERDLEPLIEEASRLVEAHLDLDRLEALAAPMALAAFGPPAPILPPPGQRIALADDDAFAFVYAAVVEGWHRAGASIHPFSPLADEAPEPTADAVILPGGYPELHAGRLAAATRFAAGVRAAADRGAAVYGECGGFMVLGEALVDADGVRHPMLGLLPAVTSFAERRLHLGYRRLRLRAHGFLGEPGALYRGHEFHYARLIQPGDAPALFDVADAGGRPLGPAGAQLGSVAGSFMHLIDRAAPERPSVVRP